jgi:hypothetical protein
MQKAEHLPESLPVLTVLIAIAVVGTSGCAREARDEICTPVAPGGLLISELRGPQTGVDTWGQWIEIYNPSASAVNVAGLRLRLTRLDGTGEVNIRIRDATQVIEPTGYLVLGRFDPADLPAHVDYGYLSDFTSDLYSDGMLELFVCNALIDTVIYRGLPATGSLSFDGGLTLTAEANDLESNWCVDASDVGGHPTEVGTPGTPGETNRPCS